MCFLVWIEISAKASGSWTKFESIEKISHRSSRAHRPKTGTRRWCFEIWSNKSLVSWILIWTIFSVNKTNSGQITIVCIRPQPQQIWTLQILLQQKLQLRRSLHNDWRLQLLKLLQLFNRSTQKHRTSPHRYRSRWILHQKFQPSTSIQIQQHLQKTLILLWNLIENSDMLFTLTRSSFFHTRITPSCKEFQSFLQI